MASDDGVDVRDRVDSVPGAATVWRSEGYLYTRRSQLRALAPARGQWRGGPGGALVGGDEPWVTHGSWGQTTPQRLPIPLLADSIRFDASGRRIAGHDGDGELHAIDLVTRRRLERAPPSLWPERTWIVEASPAHWDRWLAGPRGVIWDLREGRRQFRNPRIALGATTGTPSGFVTVDWDTHMAWTVAIDGTVGPQFRLPFDADDTIAAATWHDGAVHFESALGHRLRWFKGSLEPGDHPVPGTRPASLTTPVGALAVDGTADVEGHRYGWTEDGWLFALPLDADGQTKGFV